MIRTEVHHRELGERGRCQTSHISKLLLLADCRQTTASLPLPLLADSALKAPLLYMRKLRIPSQRGVAFRYTHSPGWPLETH